MELRLFTLATYFLRFFLVFFWPYIMIVCALKLILYKKKSISMQLLESPIPPLTAAALRMIICKGPVTPDHHLQEAGPLFWQPRKGHDKSIFETLHDEPKCFWVSTNQILMKIRIKIFTFAYGQGWGSSMWLRGWSPVLSRDGWNNYETTFGLLR